MFDPRVRVIHAVDHQLDRRMWHTGMSEEEVAEYRENTRAEAEAALHEQLSQTDYRSLKYGVEPIIANGHPDICVMQALEDEPTHLVIMGTCARGGIPGMLLGNTAERLLPQLNCSILALKPDDFVSPVKVEAPAV